MSAQQSTFCCSEYSSKYFLRVITNIKQGQTTFHLLIFQHRHWNEDRIKKLDVVREERKEPAAIKQDTEWYFYIWKTFICFNATYRGQHWTRWDSRVFQDNQNNVSKITPNENVSKIFRLHKINKAGRVQKWSLLLKLKSQHFWSKYLTTER